MIGALSRIAGIIVVASLAGPLDASARPLKVDFSGKRVDVIVPFAPGGPSDAYMRAIAPYLQAYLPGQPAILIHNIAGGASIPGATEFQANAKPDGLSAIVVSASTVASYVLKESTVDFKLNTWQPIIVSPQGAVVYAAATLGVQRPEDMPRLKNKQLVFGGESATSGELRIIVSLKLLGLKVKDVWGLQRGEPTRLAFERGRLNINYASASTYIKDVSALVNAGKAIPVFSLGMMDEQGEIVRDPNFKDLPSFPEAYEIMHGNKPSGQPFTAWKALFRMGVMANKSIFLPADTPREIADAWRQAMRKVFADRKFQKAAEGIVGGYPQFFGDAAAPIMKEATGISADAREWIRKYLKTDQKVIL